MEESIKQALLTEDMIHKASGSMERTPVSYSPLALAYIGDSVFDLMIKSRIVFRANMQVQKYHKKVSAIVRAGTQAMLTERFIESGFLSEEELAIYKRGRNATTHTKAKNASVGEYRKATGFEAMLGYLYLSGNQERLNEIMEHAVTILKDEGLME